MRRVRCLSCSRSYLTLKRTRGFEELRAFLVALCANQRVIASVPRCVLCRVARVARVARLGEFPDVRRGRYGCPCSLILLRPRNVK